MLLFGKATNPEPLPRLLPKDSFLTRLSLLPSPPEDLFLVELGSNKELLLLGALLRSNPALVDLGVAGVRVMVAVVMAKCGGRCRVLIRGRRLELTGG